MFKILILITTACTVDLYEAELSTLAECNALIAVVRVLITFYLATGRALSRSTGLFVHRHKLLGAGTQFANASFWIGVGG